MLQLRQYFDEIRLLNELVFNLEYLSIAVIQLTAEVSILYRVNKRFLARLSIVFDADIQLEDKVS